MDVIRNRETGEASGPLRLPRGMVEDAVVGEIRRMIRAPEIVPEDQALREQSPTVERRRSSRHSASSTSCGRRSIQPSRPASSSFWSSASPSARTASRSTCGTKGWARSARHDRAAPDGGLRMTGTTDTIRVVIPLTIRKRNGRPKILPPDDMGRARRPSTGSACAARHSPSMELAAAAGNRCRFHHPGYRRDREGLRPVRGTDDPVGLSVPERP